MTTKSDMIAALTEAQEHISRALKELETADDYGQGQHPDLPIRTDDARIAIRDAYHALKPIAYPPSTDPLDAIQAEG